MEDYDIGKIFSDMESDLIRSMQRNLRRHTEEEIKEGFEWTQWQALKLKELKRFQNENRDIMKSYTSSINQNVTEILKNQFLEGKSKTDREIQSAIKKGFKATKNPNKDSFFSTNDKKLNTLIDAVNNDLKTAEAAALRMTNDVYRKTIFRAQVNLNFGAKTLKQAIDMATKDFLNKGINSIEYKDGRRINIASYSEMVLRTANKRAHLQGEGAKRQEYGVTTVYVSQYNACSPTCIPWQGRVYIDDVYSGGKQSDGPYMLLSVAIKAGLFHPNCRHTMSAFFPEINDIPKTIDRSEIPENYEYQQKLSYIDRNIQKYKRLESGSLDKENIEKYNKKVIEWRNIRKQHISNNINENNKKIVENTEKYDIIKVDDISIDGITEKGRLGLENAYNTVLNHGLTTDTETLLNIDKTTGEYVTSKHDGSKSKVVLSDEDIAALSTWPKNSVICVHNHPSNSSFSGADMRVMTRFESISDMTVIGHGNTLYTLSIDEGIRPHLGVIAQDYSDFRYFTMQKYIDKIRNNEITEEQAWYEHSNEIVEGMSKKYGWKYRRYELNE